MLAVALVVLAVLTLTPRLLGGLILSRLGADLQVTAEQIGGPLWSPNLSGATVNLPGIEGKAGQVSVTVAGVDIGSRTVKLNVAAQDATVNLKLRELLKGGEGGTGGGWKVVLGGLDVKNSRVNVDGEGANIPDGAFRIEQGPGGALAVRGRTTEGELNADVQVSQGAAGNIFGIDLDADARVLNHYWPGVTAGRITGRYVLNDGPLRGDLKVTDAALRVPGAKFVTVTGVNGTATHRGDDINLRLSGRGWNGPVNAVGNVDLKAQNWTVTADADPTVAGLAEALGTTGTGNLNLRVTAGGWSTVRVKAYAKGAGQVAGLPFRDAKVEYTLLTEDGNRAGQTNDLAFSVRTALAGDQAITGRWALGRAGTAQARGTLAGQPLTLAAKIDADNKLTLGGTALGGPARGTFDLKTQALNAVLNPEVSGVGARVALTGKPSDLRAAISGGKVGPFELAGTARLNAQGLTADLTSGQAAANASAGTLTLDLDREFRGTWSARNLSGAGITLGGNGKLDATGGDLTGTLTAGLPGLAAPLTGPLNLNYLKQRGTFSSNNTASGAASGPQRLTWNGDTFGLSARNLAVVGGVTVNGDLNVTTALKATGNLTARGNGFDVTATARGDTASLRGVLGAAGNRVTVLADTQLSAGFLTTARIEGADITGTVSVQDGLRFSLTTANASGRRDTARGVIDGSNWDASGRVNLAALRPLLPALTEQRLDGTLDLALAGLGGTARINASAAGAGVSGTLQRNGQQARQPITADLNVVYTNVAARLAGRVFPDVQVSGSGTYRNGTDTPQTLNAALAGDYGNLKASLTGRTGSLSFSGVTIPAQTLNLTGSVTPNLTAAGTWGNLNVTYDARTGLARVTGRQTLTAFGQTGTVQGRATWGPGSTNQTFRGAVEASGVLDQYTVALSGPWNSLNVRLTDGEGLRATGTASLPSGRYDVDLRGPIAGGTAAGGLYIDGNVTGTGTEPRGTVSVFDGAGGSARVTLRGFSDLDVQARGLTLGGQQLYGDLNARNNVLSGTIDAGPFRLTAAGGRVRAVGEFVGQSVVASGKLTLPATVSDLNVRVDGPYLSANATGSVSDLRGAVRLNAQTFGTAQARVSVPAQVFPLTASLTGARANIGGLTFLGGDWSGAANLRYVLGTAAGSTPGQLRLEGNGAQLLALPSGPVAGRVSVLPTIGGTLSADLSPALPFLPEAVRKEFVPGRLVAQISATGAALSTTGTRYLNDPLSLTAQVGWKNGVTASGTLTHPGSRLPLRYDGRDLSIDAAVLNARTLQPVLKGLTGTLTASLTVPELDFEQANGRARVNLALGGERAEGLVSLRRGQVGADLTSTLAGLNLRVRGPLYPQADAVLNVDGVQGTLTGDAAKTLNLRAKGEYEGQAVDLTATATDLTRRGQIQLTGNVAGQSIRASGNLVSGVLSGLNLRVSGPYLSADASGDLLGLRGTVRLKAQTFGPAQARVSLPAQTLPLTASVSTGRVNVGGLGYAGGQWSGAANLRYALATTPGTLQLVGSGAQLLALPSGPVAGRVTVLPTIGGTLSADLAPALPFLPEAIRKEFVPGRLVAQISATGAALTNEGTQYVGQPLGLTAKVNWKNSVTASGTLTHPGSRIPVRYDGQTLTLDRAVLDARALQPLLSGVTGTLTASLTVPELDFEQASGRAQINLALQDQRAVGAVTVQRGQLGADLTSTLAGLEVRVRGPLYPQADAVLNVDGVQGTLTGSAADTLNLRAAGVYQGRNLNLTAVAMNLTTRAASAQLTGNVSGAAVNLTLKQAAGLWRAAGSLNVPDLRTLTASNGAGGTAGNLSATIGGTLDNLTLNAAGMAAGVRFTAPASYRSGVLRLANAVATLPDLVSVRASGPVFPTLGLSAKATLEDYLPGTYTVQATGSLSKPNVNAQGKLQNAPTGLQAEGSRVTARLLGQDYRLTFVGEPLAGFVRGQLGAEIQGQSTPGGLLDSRLALNTTYLGRDGLRVALNGATGWNARRGWLGTLQARGPLNTSSDLNATLNGSGPLNLAATLRTPFNGQPRSARVTGTLPADLPRRPGGTLELAALDVGALWGRAGQLALTGQATLGGGTWNKLAAQFAGRVEDSAGELTGDLGATYRAGDVSVRLAGPRVSGGAVLVGGKYDLTLRAEPLRLARLLPVNLNMDALTFGGTVTAAGSLAGGPSKVTLRNLALKGEQGGIRGSGIGPFSLYGSASYVWQPGGQNVLEAALDGSLRGGVLQARGQLPAGVQVTARNIDARTLGAGVLGAALKLSGDLTNPAVSGQISTLADAFSARVILSGRALSLKANARADLKGSAAGTLYAEASGLNLTAGAAGLEGVRARVYGNASSGQTSARLDLNGVWPALAGTVNATVGGISVGGVAQPLTLTGDGRGGYALNSGELGAGTVTLTRTQGLIPALAGTLRLTPLPLVGGTGTATADVTLGGTLTAPTLAATLSTRAATLSGVTLADTTGSFSGTLSNLSGTLAQAGATVATLNGQTVNLTGLTASVAGASVKATGTAALNGTADLNLVSSGALEGNLKATYRARALSLDGTLAAQGVTAALNLDADPFTGWHGTARLSGGPAGVLTQPANLTLSGPFAHPLATGDAGLLGAGARIVASSTGVQVRLVNGPGATANGAVEVRPDAAGEWKWLGATSLTRPELSLSVTPSGPLTDPNLLLSVRRGEWRASGTASLRAADLNISDGLKDGRITWTDQTVRADLPGLDLSRLGIRLGAAGGAGDTALTGRVTAQGAVNTGTRNGQLTLNIQDVNTDYELPYLGLKVNGDLAATVDLIAGRPTVQASATLPAGTLTLNAQQTSTSWTGRLTGSLAEDGGQLALNVGADAAGLTGNVTLTRFPLSGAGQSVRVDGTVALGGQTFNANLTAANEMGEARVIGSGGLADVVPALSSVLAVRPTEEGYNLRATLDAVELRELNIAPALSGRVSGEANINDGGGTFVVRSAGLTLGPKTLPARIEGTQIGGDWRIRGFLGESDLFGGLSGGELFGQVTLKSFPVGAVVGALVGDSPGEGIVTGVARFRVPVADPLAGSATVVAERIRVSASSGEGATRVTETLLGSGTLDYAARELRNVNIQLAGAGTWDVRGAFSRSNVGLTAQFTNTTFTPVLVLVPAIADLDPSLKGTLTLTVAGTYDRPRGQVRASNLSGTLAGLSLQVPTLSGDLPDSGAFTATGRVLTGGVVGSDGTLNASGQLTVGDLSATRVRFEGLLAPQALGALPNTTVTLAQATTGWTLDAQSRSTNPATGAGSLSLTGQIAPRWDLALTARNYNLPLAVIYARESALNADLRAVDDGSLIRVSGAADFLRLTLGRVGATTTIPAPGQSSTGGSSGTGRTTDSYATPLPDIYSTFPEPGRDPNAPAPARPFLQRLVLEDIPVRAPNGIRVDEALARAEFGGALVVSGTGAQPRITGDITSQRGSIFLRENEFAIQSGLVSFNGQSLYPTFAIVASGTVQASTTGQRVPVTLDVKGEFRTLADGANTLDLTTALRCTATAGASGGTASSDCTDPSTTQAYSEAQLYALVATGVPNLETLPGNLTALGASALQTALNIFVLGEIERNVARALGLDVFRLTPNLSTADGSIGATITLGSYLTRDLYLQYQIDLTGAGLIDATYSTPDKRFTFKVSTPLNGLDLQSVRPSFSAAYNVNDRASVSVGVQNNPESTKLRFGVTYRIR
ncbi:translocation/assembly module TamB domain-containing protein [Deinococcus aquatilis]|uniref:translocation/assembly module TamB domain-containing protein n=1 Tax=Deinococcus aquatilis TaxID=519440 RepID=UPI000378460D